MALVQFKHPSQSIDVTKKMLAPKTATTTAWYKQARKIITTMPSLKDSGYTIHEEKVELRWIRLDLRNHEGDHCYVIIDRSVQGLGGL